LSQFTHHSYNLKNDSDNLEQNSDGQKIKNVETSDSSTGMYYNKRKNGGNINCKLEKNNIYDNNNTNKRMSENYILDYSSNSTFSKKRLSNKFIKEDNNKFLTFDSSYRQISFMSKNFRSFNNLDLNKKLEEFLDLESRKLKIAFPNIDFNLEAIIEPNLENFENRVKNCNSHNTQNNLTISKDNLMNTSQKYPIEFKQNNVNEISNQFFNTEQLNISTSTSNFRFIIISNIYIYEFIFTTSNNTLLLKRKTHLLSIDFFTITPDLRNLTIHVNNIIDRGGNMPICYENSINIVFCLCNILFYSYSSNKNLVVVPNSNYFIQKCKKIHSFEKLTDFYNSYTDEIFKKIEEIIPYDKEEYFVKMIPVSKIEGKFTQVKVDKSLIFTNKKMYEIDDENMDPSEINILPLVKMKKIKEMSKTNKFQIISDKGDVFQYSSIYLRMLLRILKTQHSKECLLDLEIEKVDE